MPHSRSVKFHTLLLESREKAKEKGKEKLVFDFLFDYHFVVNSLTKLKEAACNYFNLPHVYNAYNIYVIGYSYIQYIIWLKVNFPRIPLNFERSPSQQGNLKKDNGHNIKLQKTMHAFIVATFSHFV